MTNIPGHRWRKLRTQFKAQCQAANLPCQHCGQPLDYTTHSQPNSFEPDHLHPISTHPHLTYQISNLAPSCVRCNRSKGATPVTDGFLGQWTQADW